MKIYHLLPVAFATAALAGCSGDSVSTLVTPDPAAVVRFVNAVPDTMPLDYRFVDIVTNASEANVAFRGNSGAYRRVPPGTHRIRAFLTGGLASAGNAPSLVNQFLVDTTLTFEVNHFYTIVHAGYAKTGSTPKQKFYVNDDVYPTAATGVSIRVFNAAPVAVDVFATAAVATGGAVTPPAAFTNVGFSKFTSYASVTTAPAAPVLSTYRITAAGTGTTTPILADALAPVGLPAAVATATSGAVGAVAGTQQAGSVLSFVVFPAAVPFTVTSTGTPGSPATGTTTTITGPATAGIITLLDKNP